MLAVVLFALIILIGFTAFFLNPMDDGLDASSQARSKLGEVDQASIAVMPFTNFSDHKDMGYFGDGLAEEILNSLAKLRELNVSARHLLVLLQG